MACLPFLCFFLFLFHLLCQPTLCSSNFSSSSSPRKLVSCPHDQSLALLHFKSSLSLYSSPYGCWSGDSSYPKTKSWKENTNCCSWDGVLCDTKTGHIIGLDLACSMLLGTLSSNSTLFLLPNIQKLDLSYNNFRGSPISVKFGQFLKLTHLNLNGSYFVGHVPSEIAHLSRLLSLDLSWNYELIIETTTFSMIVQNLTKLQQLHLSYINMSLVALNSLGNLSSSLSSLQLQSCGLKGEFPVNILGRLNLQVLDLGHNYDLTGSFPKSNGSSALSHLYLFSTRISIHLGQDYFSNLKSLKFLYLQNCNFIGSSNLGWLGNLTKLIELDLSSSALSGEIPSSLGNLLHLNYVNLGGNTFGGQIPQTFANLTQLNVFALSINKIGGQIPSFLGNFKHLTILDLSYNNFIGPILPFFGNLKHLIVLDLSYNNLIGSIPSQLDNLSLGYIAFRNNMLSGPIPTSIFKAVNLRALHLSSNHKLTGEIPSSICNLKSLQFLDLSNNSLSGFIPQCLENITNMLSVLHLGTNSLQGTIPSTFLKGNLLGYLNLNGNELKGPIPPSMINCTNLEFLDLGNNDIEDVFPQFLETLPKLQVLVLRSNKLYGFMKSATSNYSFARLRILDLSNNILSGPLPTNYFNNFKAMMQLDQDSGYLRVQNYSGYDYSMQLTWKGLETEFHKINTILTTIDFSRNKFMGKIPKSIGKLTSLQALNFSYNSFVGPIPPSLGNLTNLEALDLSSNFLDGRIPIELVALIFLQVLNLSDNRLEGPIPEGKQFNTFTSSAYEGNSGLCEFPLSKCNTGKRQPASSFQEEEDPTFADGFGWKVVVMGYASGLLFGFTMGYVMFKTRKPARLVRFIEGELLEQAKFLRRILA